MAESGRRSLRYQLVVVADNPVEVVSRAGGWLFDRAVAGWEVTVAVDAPGDIRPLMILGLGVLDLGCVLRCRRQLPIPHAFAVAGDLSALGEPAREWAHRYLGSARTDVRFWGDTEYRDTSFAQASPTQYVPTRAARAFKAYALEAVGMRPPATDVEFFRAVVGAVAAGSAVRTLPAG
ncbi:hypothetical protein [Nocardia nova]|uniref:hypothetical protein n=1 Tax=Nocardia nova TaxID=37330 RepID=UPI0025B06E84|nr:hypothetical protein [Nocardia nova]